MSAQTPKLMPDPKLERYVIPQSSSKPQSELPQLKVLRDGLAAAVAAPGTSDPTSFPEAVASAPCDDASLIALTKALKPLWKWSMDVDGLREAQAIGLIKLLKAVKKRHPEERARLQACKVFDKWVAINNDAATGGGKTVTEPERHHAAEVAANDVQDKKRSADASPTRGPQLKKAAVLRHNPVAITYTFCECGENHHGNQMIGAKAAPGDGFSAADLEAAVDVAQSRWGCEALVYDLAAHLRSSGAEAPVEIPEASVVVLKGGAAAALRTAGLAFEGGFREALALPWDAKYLCPRRRKVLNKLARSNNVVADVPQEADYAAGKGTVVEFAAAPHLAALRGEIGRLGPKFKGMIAEGNRYEDGGARQHGIGLHGDSERRRVVAVRLGGGLGAPAAPMHYQWYLRHQPVGPRVVVPLSVGDAYIMSEASVGTDWKCSSRLTLRHATGADKFTKPPK